MLTPRALVSLAGTASAALLAAALAFQVAGYIPCHLCVLQRWPHLAAALLALALLAWRAPPRAAWAGALVAAIACGLASYHAGVEWGLWSGPTTCTGSADITGLSVQDLMARINAAPVTRCDEVQWRFLGLSMAAWNALCSAGLVLVWALAARGGLARRA